MSELLVLLGSLRADSLNARLAQAALAELPAGVRTRVLSGLADLPHYDEDLDTPGQAPVSAQLLRDAVAAADAVLLVTPEYNALPSGVIKDAIDWASRPRGDASLAGKRTAVIAASASPHAGKSARENTIRSLQIAGADVLPDSVGVASAYQAFDDAGLIDPDTRAAVRDLLGALLEREPVAA